MDSNQASSITTTPNQRKTLKRTRWVPPADAPFLFPVPVPCPTKRRILKDKPSLKDKTKPSLKDKTKPSSSPLKVKALEPPPPPPPSLLPATSSFFKPKPLPSDEVPLPRRPATFTVCWICDRPKKQSPSQLCTECFMFHLRHDHQTYSRKGVKVQGCRTCRVIAKTKTGLPSVCIPGKKRLVPEHWTCSICHTPFDSSSSCVSHFLSCSSKTLAETTKTKGLTFGPDVKTHDYTPMAPSYFLYFLTAWREGIVKTKGLKTVATLLLKEVGQEELSHEFIGSLQTTLAKWRQTLAKGEKVVLFFKGGLPWKIQYRHLDRLEILMNAL